MGINRRECLTTMLGALSFARLGTEAQAQEKEPPVIAGPDPDTRTPVYKPPKGAIDCHTHIFGPPDRYPYSPRRPYTPPPAPLAMFQALHAKLGIDRAVIVNATVHGTDNKVVTDAIAESGGRYLGVANIDETISDKQLEDLAAAGMRGCRLAFLSRLGGTPDIGRIERFAERIAHVGWHIDLYFEAIKIDAFLPTLKRLKIPYVIDHMGAWNAQDGIDHPAFKALVGLLHDDERCWMKITGPERMSVTGAPFHDAVPFAQKLIEAAPDRVIWGTDWPHPNVKTMPNDGDLVDLIPLYAPDEAMQRKLLIDNPTRLFGFKG